MPRGGYRPGAGMKKGIKTKKTLEQKAAADLLRKEVSKEYLPLIFSAIQSAKGLIYGRQELSKIDVIKNDKGKIISKKEIKKMTIFKRAPDSKMLTDLLDRMAGKAIQPVGGPGDGLDELTKEVRKLFNIKE